MHNTRAVLAALNAAVITATFATAASAQTPSHKQVLAASEAEQPSLVTTLKDLVSIESGSGNAAGLASMANYTETRLKSLGAKTERATPSRGNAPIVQGSFSGSGTQRIMLIAHMDTVYPENTLATQPIKQEGNKLYGPGIADDKGGISVILHSLKVLQDLKWRNYAQLTVVFNADEEIGSPGSGAVIAKLAADHDVVMSFEATPAKEIAKSEGLLLNAGSAALATMEVKGRQAHAGASPERGRNALIELSHQIVATQDVAKNVPGAQLNWTKTEAGEAINQIPERAVAKGDVRFTVADAPERLQAALQEKVRSSQLVPDTSTTVKIDVARPLFVAGDAAKALATHAQSIYAELDNRPLRFLPGTSGSTDAGFAALSGKAVVLESFGLAGFGYHARDEYIEIDSIVPRLYLTTRLLMDIGSGAIQELAR